MCQNQSPAIILQQALNITTQPKLKKYLKMNITKKIAVLKEGNELIL